MEKRIERLDNYLSYKKISTNKLSVMAQLSTGVISKSRDANRDLSNDACKKILSVCPDLNPEWLYDGKGDMLNNSTSQNISQTVNGVGNNNLKITTMDKAIDEIVAQRKLTEEALRQNSKSQEQIDRLLKIIENDRGM